MLEALLILLFIVCIGLSVALFKLKPQKNNKEDSSTPQGYENFVKESRDWAFQYIEEVQKGIYQAIDDLKPLSKSKSKASKEIARVVEDLAALVPSKK